MINENDQEFQDYLEMYEMCIKLMKGCEEGREFQYEYAGIPDKTALSYLNKAHSCLQIASECFKKLYNDPYWN